VKYCPACKCEYLDKATICADCNASLVDHLPEKPPVEYIKYKELLFTYSPSDVAFLKSLFSAHNIKYHIQGEHFLQIRPMAQPVGIMIDEEQYEEVKELLKEFKPRFTGFSPRDDEDEYGKGIEK